MTAGRLARRAAPWLQWVAIAMLLAPAVPLAAQLSALLPEEVPSRETLAAWERISGEVETMEELVVYDLYVNPRRGQLYELTHYRVTHVSHESGQVTRRAESEKLVWHKAPGKEPPRCFELLEDGTWRQLVHGTREYQLEMGMAMHVYGLHRRALYDRERQQPR